MSQLLSSNDCAHALNLLCYLRFLLLNPGFLLLEQFDSGVPLGAGGGFAGLERDFRRFRGRFPAQVHDGKVHFRVLVQRRALAVAFSEDFIGVETILDVIELIHLSRKPPLQKRTRADAAQAEQSGLRQIRMANAFDKYEHECRTMITVDL